MKLRPIGPNARVVETAAGAVLFSYEDLVAVKVVVYPDDHTPQVATQGSIAPD